ncbi:GNAT family N-acetyltransferase [Enterobacter hormaechei]|uniref:GNAT family N-acetyltransferase n=3 Tax=Enterobacter hormaechei TaxID=158836 RepID=UPI002F262152
MSGVLLDKLYLAPTKTNQHYGQLMFKKVIDLARSDGKKFLWLEVLEQNEHAHRFYKKQGNTIHHRHRFRNRVTAEHTQDNGDVYITSDFRSQRTFGAGCIVSGVDLTNISARINREQTYQLWERSFHTGKEQTQSPILIPNPTSPDGLMFYCYSSLLTRVKND